MISLKVSLKKIIGGIIRQMAEWFLNLGTIWIPVSMLFLFFAVNESTKTDANWLIVWTAFGMGVVLGSFGCIALSKAYDRLKRKQHQEGEYFEKLMTEIKDFHMDMTGGNQSERKDSND